MGDPTRVEITIHKDIYNRLAHTFFDSVEELETEFGICDTFEHSDNTVTIGADERNYAGWEELEEILIENEYEYDKKWYEGGEYGGGMQYWRKIKGKYKTFEIYDHDIYLIETLKEILKAKDIKKAINKHIKKAMLFEPTPLQPLKCNAEKFIEEINKKKKLV